MQHRPSSCTTIGDDEAIREGCEWVHHFEQIDPACRLVYRCIGTLLELGGADGHRAALEHLYGRATLATVEGILEGKQRCFGIEAPGPALKGCDLHQSLLAAYAKLSHQGPWRQGPIRIYFFGVMLASSINSG